MTKERLNKEILYQASLSPFRVLLSKGIISTVDYRLIDSVLRAKYKPLFVDNKDRICLDNIEK